MYSIDSCTSEMSCLIRALLVEQDGNGCSKFKHYLMTREMVFPLCSWTPPRESQDVTRADGTFSGRSSRDSDTASPESHWQIPGQPQRNGA